MAINNIGNHLERVSGAVDALGKVVAGKDGEVSSTFGVVTKSPWRTQVLIAVLVVTVIALVAVVAITWLNDGAPGMGRNLGK